MEEARQNPTTGCVWPQAAADWPAHEMYEAKMKTNLSEVDAVHLAASLRAASVASLARREINSLLLTFGV